MLNIFAGLQKDVKRINKCLTLDGAQEYINQRPGWDAFEEDITGPGGEPDGIPEVIVTDSHGNIKVVNGSILAKSTYPQRKLYQTIKRGVYDGKYRYSDFNKDLYKIHNNFNENGKPYYEQAQRDTKIATFHYTHLAEVKLIIQHLYGIDDHRLKIKVIYQFQTHKNHRCKIVHLFLLGHFVWLP